MVEVIVEPKSRFGCAMKVDELSGSEIFQYQALPQNPQRLLRRNVSFF